MECSDVAASLPIVCMRYQAAAVIACCQSNTPTRGQRHAHEARQTTFGQLASLTLQITLDTRSPVAHDRHCAEQLIEPCTERLSRRLATVFDYANC